MTAIKRTMHPIFRALINVFIAMIGAYGLSVTGFLVLRLVGEQWIIVEIFNSFAHLLFIPAFVLIPLCLLIRRFRLIVVLIPPVVAFLLSYSIFFTQRSTNADPDAPKIHILTYNLKSQTENLDSSIAIIRDSDADVVALQELSEEAAAILAETFVDEYPNQALHPQPGEPVPGQGILSRYPIISDEYWRIYLGHQKVAIEINEQLVTLYNLHPIHPLTPNGIPRRAEEITELLNRAANDSGPLMIVGDFNMTDQSADYGRITTSYADTYREVGWGMGFTFPDFSTQSAIPGGVSTLGFIRPLARIDYVFHNEGFQAVDAIVWSSSGGSDHRPLRATLALARAE